MTAVKVAIIDDHVLVREGIRMFLETDAEVDVVGEAGDIATGLEVIQRTQPDVILLDVMLGEESALDHIRTISGFSPPSRIIVLTGIVDRETNRRAASDGARGIVLKSQASQSLLKAIKKVHEGEVWFDRSFTATLLDDIQRSQLDSSDNRKIRTLTVREREIVALIAKGLVNKEIAQNLNISEKTVRNHLTVVFSKLGLSGRLALALYAKQHNISG